MLQKIYNLVLKKKSLLQWSHIKWEMVNNTIIFYWPTWWSKMQWLCNFLCEDNKCEIKFNTKFDNGTLPFEFQFERLKNYILAIFDSEVEKINEYNYVFWKKSWNNVNILYEKLKKIVKCDMKIEDNQIIFSNINWEHAFFVVKLWQLIQKLNINLEDKNIYIKSEDEKKVDKNPFVSIWKLGYNNQFIKENNKSFSLSDYLSKDLWFEISFDSVDLYDVKTWETLVTNALNDSMTYEKLFKEAKMRKEYKDKLNNKINLLLKQLKNSSFVDWEKMEHDFETMEMNKKNLLVVLKSWHKFEIVISWLSWSWLWMDIYSKTITYKDLENTDLTIIVNSVRTVKK